MWLVMDARCDQRIDRVHKTSDRVWKLCKIKEANSNRNSKSPYRLQLQTPEGVQANGYRVIKGHSIV